MRDVLSISIDDLIFVDSIRTLFGVEVQTPNLDRLAAQGVSFSNAFCTTALCEPSRTSILTGQSPFTTGVHFNADDWTTRVDVADTLPNVFRAAGYDALGFGKVFGSTRRSDEIFDRFSDHYDKPSVNDQIDGRSADALNVRDAVAALAAHDRVNPLLLMVGLHDPHGPFVSPAQYRDLYPLSDITLPGWTEYAMPEFVRVFLNNVENRSPEGMRNFVQSYLANISEMDARLGELLAAVKADPDFDPVIALWSDHGYSLGDHDHIHKFTLWDQTGRTPLIIVDPDRPASRGMTYEGVTSTLDIAPTLLDLAGVPVPAYMEGRTLTSVLDDPSDERGGAALTTMFGSVSIRTSNWRYTRYEDGSRELFNVSSDPENVVNLADDARFILARANLEALLADKLAVIGVTIDEAHNLVAANKGRDDSTYFVTHTSDLRDLVDTGGTDTLYISKHDFILPNWAEKLSAAGSKDDQRAGRSFDGNAHNNELAGALGNDTIRGMGGADLIRGERGDDVLLDAAGASTIDGGLGNDLLLGRGGHDMLNGAHNNDTIHGGSGDDAVFGSLGSDELQASHGLDTLVGGSGSDSFVFERLVATRTIVNDFSPGVDRVILRGSMWHNATVKTVDGDSIVAFGSQRLIFEGTPDLRMDDFIIEG